MEDMEIEQELNENGKKEDYEIAHPKNFYLEAGIPLAKVKKGKKKRNWEDVVEIIFPEESKSSCNEEEEEVLNEAKKKGKKGNKSKAEEESIEKKIEHIQNREGQIGEALKYCEQFSRQMNEFKETILINSFQFIVSKVEDIVTARVPEQGSFVNFVFLQVDRSHADLVETFNDQLSKFFSNSQQISIARFPNTLPTYKMLTFMKEEIEEIYNQLEKKNQYSESQDAQFIFCVLGENAYDIDKNQMSQFAKFLREEYEERLSNVFITVILPSSSAQRMSDIPIFSVDLFKSKDLFARFILMVLKDANLPIVPPQLLLTLLNELDLYSLSFSESVRRVILTVTHCIATDPIILSFQKSSHKSRQEVSAAIIFLEKVFGVQSEVFSLSKKEINLRIIDVGLRKSQKYMMSENQKESFLEDVDESLNKIKLYLEESQDHYIFFTKYISVIENIDEELEKAANKQKKLASSANLSRYDKLKKNQASKESNNPKQIALLKLEKIESLIRELVQNSIHSYLYPTSSNQAPSWLIQIDQQEIYKMIKPDFMESILASFTQEGNEDDKSDKRKLMDGMILLQLCLEKGRDINIQESFKEYGSFLREIKDPRYQPHLLNSSYYNAVCELRYKGLIEEKKKLKNQFIKHFFAKASFCTQGKQE